MIEKVKQLRKELHANPELSGFEFETVARIETFIKTFHPPSNIITLGNSGLAIVYQYSNEGETVMIRCELDALPIEETNKFIYKSTKKGVSHKCGHDGHMAIVAGLIFWIKEQHFKHGKIVLLFQPAEETGKGALEILKTPAFKKLNPDYIFALHNIPGQPIHTIITVKNNFSPAVESVAIFLTGKESHASEPENGLNPALAIQEILHELNTLNIKDDNHDQFALLTPIYIKMGQEAYGISAGEGELHYTLRTWTVANMSSLKTKLEKITNVIATKHHLQIKIDWFDAFPTTKNNDFCNQLVVKAAQSNNFKVKEKMKPFKFGEDFGWFSHTYKSAMFGLGAGENCPALHNESYDFPEELLNTGIQMFGTIISMILNNQSKKE